jgi:spermidine synthase
MNGDELLLAEYLTPSEQIVHAIEEVLLDERTEFQSVKIVRSRAHGKALMLDGVWQSCTRDEFIYHESLVHPVMLAHGHPRSVLILGGGEGATAREVLRWRGVQEVLMVDIDGDVVEYCRTHLPEMHRGAFDDPRLQVRIGDALAFLHSADRTWDVVISDLSDPIEYGPSFRLFTREYFDRVRRVVAPDGRFVVQSGTISPVEVHSHARLHRTVADSFGHACTFLANVPSFGTPWSFVLGSADPIDPRPDPRRTDGLLLRSLYAPALGFINGDTVLGTRLLPPYLLRALRDPELEAYTLADPPRFGAAS